MDSNFTTRSAESPFLHSWLWNVFASWIVSTSSFIQKGSWICIRTLHLDSKLFPCLSIWGTLLFYNLAALKLYGSLIFLSLGDLSFLTKWVVFFPLLLKFISLTRISLVLNVTQLICFYMSAIFFQTSLFCPTT